MWSQTETVCSYHMLAHTPSNTIYCLFPLSLLFNNAVSIKTMWCRCMMLL
jgi:hypothetical protein